jgi:hypothetical protein
MRTHSIGAALIPVLISTASGLHATGNYTLETAVFVFKDSEVRTVEIPTARTAGDAGSLVFRSPASARFGEGALSLAGSDYSWGDGKNPPDSISKIAVPEASLTAAKPVTLLFSSPVQYFEKAADGSLQVREIAVDSPDAPHWRLTFKLAPEVAGDGDLLLSCDVDIASVSARESLPGVTLPVGRPVLSRFNEKLQMQLARGEWSAFVVRAPGESDYTMLTLLKVRPGQPSADAAGRERPMTAQEFVVFATYYYRNPQPERIAHAIESLASNGFLKSSVLQSSRKKHTVVRTEDQLQVAIAEQARMAIVVGFFAEVFESNPEMVPQWKALLDRKGQDAAVRFWLGSALTLGQAGVRTGLAAKESDGVNLNKGRVAWGAFLASGDTSYLQQLLDQLELVYSSDLGSFLSGAGAMTLLAFQAQHHPLVLQTLESARKDSSPRTRELIDDLLTKDYATVQQQLSNMQPEPWSTNIDWGLTTNPGGIPPPPPPRMEQR